MWSEIGSTIRDELGDLPNAAALTRVTMRLVFSAVLGGLIGWDRERRGKSAGIRTHILVAMGSALFLIVPMEMKVPLGDVMRVVQGLLAGIGFLGAGAIIKHESAPKPSEAQPNGTSIQGLTTAASVWMTAAIGVAIGLGHESTALLSTIFALIVLAVLPQLEHRSKRDDPHA